LAARHFSEDHVLRALDVVALACPPEALASVLPQLGRQRDLVALVLRVPKGGGVVTLRHMDEAVIVERPDHIWDSHGVISGGGAMTSSTDASSLMPCPAPTKRPSIMAKA